MLLPLVILAAGGIGVAATRSFLQRRGAASLEGEKALSLGRDLLQDAGRHVALLSSEAKAELARRGFGTTAPQPEPGPVLSPPDRPRAARKNVAPQSIPHPVRGTRAADVDAAASVAPRLRVASPSAAWRGARWGMRAAEIVRLFAGKAVLLDGSERQTIDGLVSAAAIPRVRIGEHLFALSFLFDRSGGLAAIQLRLLGPGVEAAFAYEGIVSQLSTDYGVPPEHSEEFSPSGSWARRARWTAPGGLIELRGGETVLRESRVISVNVREGLMRPVPEGGVLLTYRPAPTSSTFSTGNGR